MQGRIVTDLTSPIPHTIERIMQVAMVAPPFQNGKPFELPADPFYLVGKIEYVRDNAPIPVADSALDFSFFQGQGG